MYNFSHLFIFNYKEFRKHYENPILRGQDSCASDEERKKAAERLEQLISLVNRCLIRRTSTLLSQYLPPKTEQVVCIKMNELQTSLYQHLMKSDALRKTMKSILNLKLQLLMK